MDDVVVCDKMGYIVNWMFLSTGYSATSFILIRLQNVLLTFRLTGSRVGVPHDELQSITRNMHHNLRQIVTHMISVQCCVTGSVTRPVIGVI